MVVKGMADVQVEQTDDYEAPYILRTKRAVYSLFRNQLNPKHLFVVGCGDSGKLRINARVKGYEWFKETDGELIPIR